MQAVMYGGGNIGRGFIGALFQQSGYEVTFIDVVESVVTQINRDGQYPVRTLTGDTYTDAMITGVKAVNGRDVEAAASAIDQADIMATAVGVNALKFIVPVLVAGLRKRFARNAKPLNIIICENLLDANKVLEKMLKEQLSAEECARFDGSVGLVEASIGRMVPVQTKEMQDGNPLRVCVERYGFLPVDKDAFVGEIPPVKNMVPSSPFDFYIRRKLFLHNMGHAACAYLGMYAGREYIFESIADGDVQAICYRAMVESAVALAGAYHMPVAPLLNHVSDLLHRFTNAALKDTCARVGGDPVRKLKSTDRLIGAMLLCEEQGVVPAFIAVGAAGGLRQYLREKELPQSEENALAALNELAGLRAEDAATKLILPCFMQMAAGADIRALRETAEALELARLGDIL